MYRRLKRGPQVILPKDIGIILSYSGVNKDSVCVDAGTGSGWLALSLARICKHVYSYELREDFIAIAEKNREMLNLDNIKESPSDPDYNILEEYNILETNRLNKPNFNTAVREAINHFILCLPNLIFS